MTRIPRWLAPALMILGAALPAAAQPPAEEKGFFDVPAPEAPASGDPLYGYIGTAFLGAGMLFAVAKSSRRS